MKIGGDIPEKWENLEEWIERVKAYNYSTAICPLGSDASEADIHFLSRLITQNNLTIAEVGIWNNTISPNDEERQLATSEAKKRLYLADRIGACCSVNIAGSRSKVWDGPHRTNFSSETFDMIVEKVREIIDEVQPRRTFYTLETMPWIFPESADSYLKLIRAIDRSAFAVHFDPVNLLYSPKRYFNHREIIDDFVSRLGAYIKSCHVKDVVLDHQFPACIREVRPGKGTLDLGMLLICLSRLHGDLPIIMEHLHSKEEYLLAGAHIRATAKTNRVSIV
ncbi:MAG: TIM barrel protein [Reichenbachiella sp.]|uniref:sugar phosphate isomerase/epimerase family protein n=1 Tax=Reichenbachiella sp. TaxID=2184521 RepID=UPI0032672A3E